MLLIKKIPQTLVSLYRVPLAMALGLVLLIACSQVEVPVEPVPFTLQTLGIFLLGIFYSPKNAFYVVLGYLALATMGFPVLAVGYVNPLWMLHPSAGYLLGFLIAAPLMAWLCQKMASDSLFKTFLAIIAGDAVIYLCGLGYLSFYVEYSQLFWIGLVPYLPGCAFKIAVALCCKRAARAF